MGDDNIDMVISHIDMGSPVYLVPPGRRGGVPQVKAVQVDPIKPTFKPPGIKLLKLKHDEMLSILLQFCFQIQLAPLQQGGAPVPALRGHLPCFRGRG
jgi:hypothetical protein